MLQPLDGDYFTKCQQCTYSLKSLAQPITVQKCTDVKEKTKEVSIDTVTAESHIIDHGNAQDISGLSSSTSGCFSEGKTI